MIVGKGMSRDMPLPIYSAWLRLFSQPRSSASGRGGGLPVGKELGTPRAASSRVLPAGQRPSP
eukprot:6022564-Lingulodinium_polyedra.AAC.1